MLAVLGLVLPLAGTPLRYCQCVHLLLVGAQSACPCEHPVVTQAERPCCQQKHQPLHPAAPQHDCMIGVKLLPDAVAQADPATPAPQVAELPPVAFAVPLLPPPLAAAGGVSRERGPPGAVPPLYLRHRSLLL
jgi:hypothetical protein